MRSTRRFVLIAAVLFDLGLALPSNAEGPEPAKVQPIPGSEPTFSWLSDANVPDFSTGGPAQAEGGSKMIAAEDDENKYRTICDEPEMAYYWPWWPMTESYCQWADDGLERGFYGKYPAAHEWAAGARFVHIKWNRTGDNCEGTCRQVFNRLHRVEECRAERFWIKEKANLSYAGCGEASYWIEYQLGPMLDHGTGLCWESVMPPSYTPDKAVVKEFCEEAVTYVSQVGRDFLSVRKRPGYFWTDYDRKVSRSEDASDYFDSGFVHFWIKPTQWTNVCGPGQLVENMIESLNVEQCTQRFATIESMKCGAPGESTFGGRLWADCFEWGVKASGYDGKKAPV